MLGITFYGYPLRDLLMSILLGSLSYFLVYYPSYFATVVVGLGALLFSPLGSYLLRPHADNAIDFIGNASAGAMTDVMSMTISEVTGQPVNVASTRSFIVSFTEGAINDTVTGLDMTVEKWIATWAQMLLDTAGSLTNVESMVVGWSGFISTAVNDIFGFDLLAIFQETAGGAMNSTEVSAAMLANLSIMGVSAITDMHTRESLASGTKNAIRTMLDDPGYVGELVTQITTAATSFRDALSVAGASYSLDPVAVEAA